MSTQDFFTSRRNFDDGATRIGEEGRLWFDAGTLTIRVSDGVTPGGIILTFGGGGGGSSGYSGTSGYSGSSVILKGSVANFASLPGGAVAGDLWVTLDTGDGWVYDGATWLNVGPILGASGFSGYSGQPGTIGVDGVSGYSGAPGAPGSTLVYPFTLTTTANVVHNFNQWPIVSVIDVANRVVIPETITYNTLNDLTVTFSYATSGNVIVISAGLGLSGYSGIGGGGGSGAGFSGYSGTSGYSGQDGVIGVDGISGYSGRSGWSGYSGRSGYSGYSGSPGASGYSGPMGPMGPSGGVSGYSGTSGFSGLDGLATASGFSGYSGASGMSGQAGGLSGYSGFSGYSGEAMINIDGGNATSVYGGTLLLDGGGV